MRDLLYDRIYRVLSERPKRGVETVEQFTLGSIVGSVRDKNEDVAVIANIRHASTSHKDYTLAIVCDGMGGMADGRKAALIAATTFVSRMLRVDRFNDPSERLTWALGAAQHEVFNELHGDGGTTLSALYLDQAAQGWLVHVGDSRIYAVAADGALRQLSRDDTIGAALNREHEKRPDFNRLIQFVGVDGDLEPQLLRVSRGDCKGFLLTSDGAHSAPPEILSMVAQHAQTAAELVRKLLSLADALGGLDNATAVHIPSTVNNPTPSYHVQGADRDGILATILCASGAHDIWITQTDPQDNARSQRDLRPVAEELKTDKPKDPVHREKFQRTKKGKLKPPKAQTRSREELQRDVDKPVARLDFSDDGEVKS